jgi:hypothetical protein
MRRAHCAGYTGPNPLDIAPTNASTRVVLFGAFILLVAARLPEVLLKGRFWAEEGSVYFVDAWRKPFFDALVSAYPADYWNFTASAATLVAAYTVKLQYAPLVTTMIALVVQSIPALLIVTSRMSWTRQPLVLVAALLIIAMPPGCEETWLNSINSQHHLALSVGIILALETEKGARLLLHVLVLLLAVLSSPGTWFLIPLFGLRAALERSGPRVLQTFILLAGLGVQLGFFFALRERTFGMHPSLLGAIILIKHVALPMFGRDWAQALARRMATLFSDGDGPLWPLVVTLVLFGGLLACALRAPRAPPLWFLLAATFLGLGSYLSAFGDKILLISAANGARYQLGAHVLLMLGILSWVKLGFGWTRYVAVTMVTWALVVQVPGFFHPPGVFATGPDWQKEIQLKKDDSHHLLRIWPDGYVMQF